MKKVKKYFLLLFIIIFLCPESIYAQSNWTRQNPYPTRNPSNPSMSLMTQGAGSVANFTSDAEFEDNYPEWYSGFDPDPRITEGISPTWVREYGTPTDPSVEQYNAVVLDDAGNIYAGGQSEEPFPRYSIGILAKYDSNGNLQWLVREKGVGSIDRLDLDAAGNVYAGGGDVMLKFDSQGNKMWSIDTCGSLTAVDADGNVFSTSSHDLAPEGSIREIVTRKYNSDGMCQWTACYSFKAGSVNDPTDIEADGAGGVVITGGGDLTGTSPGSITVRYASDGSEQWRAKFNIATGGSVTLDKSGSVFNFITNNEGRQYTLKYNNSGTPQWATGAYGNTRGKATDENGNVLVVLLDNAGRWCTVKYDQSGVQKWQQIYDKSFYTEDPRDLTVDNQGNIYVAGISTLDSNGQSHIVVLCYDPEGINKGIYECQDTTSCAYSQPLTVDSDGNVFVVGGIGSNKALLLKFISAGIQHWMVEYDAPGIYMDAALGMDLDSQGNIYVCGTRNNRWSPGGRLSILKYNPQGDLLWKHIDESASISNVIMKVIADGSLCLLYIESYYENDISFNVFHFDNIDADGNLRWSVKHQPQANIGLQPAEILFNMDGDIYIIVGRSGPDTTTAILLQKFSSGGDSVWSKELFGKQIAGNRHAVLDKTGNLSLTAIESSQPNSFSVLKYNSSGLELWNKTYSAPQGYTCGPSSLVNDVSGAVYVTSWCQSNSNLQDILTVKFDQDGTQRWVSIYDGPDHGTDVANDIGADSNGNIFVGGTSDSSGYGLITLVSYLGGAKRWVHQFPGSWLGMFINEIGEVYVMGNDGDIISIKYSNSGTLLSNARYMSPIGRPVAITLDHHDHLYMTGNNEQWSGGWGHGRPSLIASIITTLCFDLVPNSAEILPPPRVQTFTLHQNYPNPFNPSTNIQFSIPKSESVTLEIYNLLGQRVATLVDGKQEPGQHTVQFDGSGLASGVYFYQLRTKLFVSTKKFLLLK